MGAYLHIIDELPDSFKDRESIRYLNQRGSRSGWGNFTSTRDIVSPLCIAQRQGSSASQEMDECSSFWAGQMDDCFEDFRARRIETPVGRKGYSTREGRMGRKGGEKSGSSSGVRPRNVLDRGGGSSFSRFDFPKRKATETVVLEADKGCMGSGCRDAGVSGTRDAERTCLAVDSLNTPGASIQDMGCKLLAQVEVDATVDEDVGWEDKTERLPDHLLVEVLIRVPARDWPAAACVKKRWGQLFDGDGFWHTALMRQWPRACLTKRWPGPISRGPSKRRFMALHISNNVFMKDKVEGIDEVAGHVYLFLKEQLESSTPPASYGLLHGTIIDQFLACSKTGDEAHELASLIWVAVLDNLDDTENTFHLLMRIAEEWEVFLPYPYTKSNAVQWRLFERLFTDFRDCLSQYNYFDVLTRAKHKFDIIPAIWLGY